MADFQQFFPTLLKFEGGRSDDPDDPGGVTNMGITLPIFKQHARTLLRIAPTQEALLGMTREQAARIYKIEYWDRTFGDENFYQPLAEIVFDFYVNAGHPAICLLFHVLNAQGGNFDTKSMLQSSVIASLQHHDIVHIYSEYKEGRKAYYRTLAGEHPLLRRFLHGWLRRVDSFPDARPPSTGSRRCPPAAP